MLLGAQFLIWLERRLQYLALGRLIKPPDRKPVLIDLEYLVPPVEPLVRLIEAGYPLVFASLESTKLKESLDLLMTRLERTLEKNKARTYGRAEYFGFKRMYPKLTRDITFYGGSPTITST